MTLKTTAAFFCIMLGMHTAYADNRFPIYYFQIENQERYVYPSDMETMSWREIRKRREQLRTSGQDEKRFRFERIVQGNTPSVLSSSEKMADIFRFSPDDCLENAPLFVRDPNGDTRPLSVLSDTVPHIALPEDKELTGRYLLGAYLELGEHDMDGDGMKESVAISAKYMASHYKNGGRVGSASVVFFDDPDQMPLEIGPVINTAKSRFGGGIQFVHQEYEMMAKYLGRPLANAPVTVLSIESKWQKSFMTDNDGIFEIIPTDDRSVSTDFQNYLYIATHHDHEKGAYHIATFPVTIYKNRPEWRSKAVGFIFWTILGTGMTILTVFGFMIRKKRQHNRRLVVFENHKIKEDLP